jgi:outer membrane lipoprotein LolB
LFFDLRTAVILLLPALGVALLPGCAVAPPSDAEQSARQPLYDQRAARLGQLENWALSGRLAVSDDEDGGSGSLSWRQQPGGSRMDFHGALGRGAWRLLSDEAGAELEFADGRRYRADSIDALVHGQIGWHVPVDKLAWWVRGLAAPGVYAERRLDEGGRLSRLDQDGWSIEFGRYGAVGGETLPLRMTARQQGRTVKIAIKKWELAAAHEP